MNSNTLRLPNDRGIEVGQANLHSALGDGRVDGLIIEGEWGCDLRDYGGRNGVLELDRRWLEHLFSANQKKEEITVIGLPYGENGSNLKAIAFVPTYHYRCYRKLAVPDFGKPYRDFHYSTVYEALNLLAGFGCSNIAIAGLTGSLMRYHDMDYRNSVTEAVAHFALENQSLHRILTVGYGPVLTTGIQFLNEHPEQFGRHRRIQSKIFIENDIKYLTFELSK